MVTFVKNKPLHYIWGNPTGSVQWYTAKLRSSCYDLLLSESKKIASNIVCALGYQPPSPQRHHLFFSKSPLKSANCPSLPLPRPLFRQFPLYIVFFCEIFLSIAPSHLLKVTKFLVKISQFKFLIITEKNIFFINFFITKYFRFKIPLESFWSV